MTQFLDKRIPQNKKYIPRNKKSINFVNSKIHYDKFLAANASGYK